MSLCAAIASWVFLPFIGSIIAVITGHMARRQIRETGEEGDVLAIIGLVVGYANLAIAAIGILVLILMALGAASFAIFS